MRPIKFRAWDKKNEYMPYFTLQEITKLGDTWFEEDVVWQQFTGLKDKNGKEIYEGDIVEYEAVYGYDDLGADLRLDILEVKFEAGMFVGLCEQPIEELNCEIIGNIYENPELIAERSKND